MIPAIVPADAAVAIASPTVAARMAHTNSTPTINIAVFSLFGLRRTATTAIASATAGKAFIARAYPSTRLTATHGGAIRRNGCRRYQSGNAGEQRQVRTRLLGNGLLRYDELAVTISVAPRVVKQQSLFPPSGVKRASFAPEGLGYRPDFVTEAEEHALATALSRLPLKPFEFHGYLGNRRVLSFGLRYDYSRRGVELAAPPPPILDALRARVAEFAGRKPEEFRQIGINEYRAGAGIGWHKDKPEFGDVVGISLLSAVRVRFRKRSGDGWTRASHLMEPRSVYI